MTKYLNLEFIVLGPPTLAADEASAVVNSAVLDHLLRLKDHAPATRTPVLNPAVGYANGDNNIMSWFLNNCYINASGDQSEL